MKIRYTWEYEGKVAVATYTLGEIERGLCVPPKTRSVYWDCISRDRFTGLIDGNGKEVYENDSVSLNELNTVESSDIYFNVQWCPKHFQWIIYYNEVDFYNLYDYDLWVV